MTHKRLFALALVVVLLGLGAVSQARQQPNDKDTLKGTWTVTKAEENGTANDSGKAKDTDKAKDTAKAKDTRNQSRAKRTTRTENKGKETGGKENKKIAYHHSGYPGGLTETPYARLLEKRPRFVVEKAVKGMLPKNSLGRAMAKKLQVYEGAEHPHEAQKPVALALGETPKWEGLPVRELKPAPEPREQKAPAAKKSTARKPATPRKAATPRK